MVLQTCGSHMEECVPLRMPSAGLSGMIVLHSTTLDPAAGGCRLWSYLDLESASSDAIRLAEGMTYKNALAGLPFGGGKAVIDQPRDVFDRRKLFEAFGDAVKDLRGRYVTAEDVGTSVMDMQTVATRTRHVAGLPSENTAPGGDPSPWTARGVYLAMKYASVVKLGKPLRDCTVAIQGVGHVGSALADMLRREGASTIVADIDREAVARVVRVTGAVPASVDDIAGVPADIFAPCALGAFLNGWTIPTLKAKLVCGAANNQLAASTDAEMLADRGIVYCPDYVVNSGGIINVAAEYLGWTAEDVRHRVDAIPHRLAEVFARAEDDGVSNAIAADLLARAMVTRPQTETVGY